MKEKIKDICYLIPVALYLFVFVNCAFIIPIVESFLRGFKNMIVAPTFTTILGTIGILIAVILIILLLLSGGGHGARIFLFSALCLFLGSLTTLLTVNYATSNVTIYSFSEYLALLLTT